MNPVCVVDVLMIWCLIVAETVVLCMVPAAISRVAKIKMPLVVIFIHLAAYCVKNEVNLELLRTASCGESWTCDLHVTNPNPKKSHSSVLKYQKAATILEQPSHPHQPTASHDQIPTSLNRQNARSKRRSLDKHRRRNPQSLRFQIRPKPMGPRLLPPSAQNPQTMQSTVVGMARPRNPQGRVVEGRRREVIAFGEVDADTMEDYCAYCWAHGYAVS